MNTTLHPVLWLWIPIMILIAQSGIELFTPPQYLPDLHSEGGPHEILQFSFATLALLWALRCLWILWPQKNPYLIAWAAFFCLGCTYIAGEEVSWGQHFFDWATPEAWQDMNDQNETNLHNISSWLDQKPKLLLLISVVVGGLIIPALQKWKPGFLPQQFAIIYPSAILGVTAACTVIIKIIDKTQDHFDDKLLTRPSEVEEIYLFYFVLLYLICFYQKISAAKLK